MGLKICHEDSLTYVACGEATDSSSDCISLIRFCKSIAGFVLEDTLEKESVFSKT